MKFYLQNPKTGQFAYVDTLNELVAGLEELCPLIHGVSREQFMQNLIELGHGYDDDGGVTFTSAMAENVPLGVVRNGEHVKCDVHSISSFQKEEYGD